MIPPMNGMTVYALGDELDTALAGAAVRAVRRFSAGMTIGLDGAPFRFIHILCHRREPELFVCPDAIAPPAASIEDMEGAKGRRIGGVRSLGFERVLIIRLAGGSQWGDQEELLLRIDLTPASKPLSLYRASSARPLAAIGSRTARRPAGPNEALPPKAISILSVPEEPPSDILSAFPPEESSGTAPEHTRQWNAVRSTAALLSGSIGGVDPVLAEGLSRTTGGDIRALWPLLVEIGGALARGRWSWHLYELGGKSGASALYPIGLPIEAPGKTETGFAEALAARARELVIPSYTAYLKRTAEAGVSRQIKRLERLEANLTSDLDDADHADEYRHFGNLLVTYRHLLTPGMARIVVRDFSGDREVTIPLDPSRSPDHNIRLYFTRAKKGQKGKLIIRNRRREVEREIARRTKELDRISRLESPSDLLALLPRERTAGAQRRIEREPSRFRRFVIDERHTVYVGRNDAENDLLTHRFASPSDLWFHAQGAAGSHVILRGAHASTPAAVIEKAASIAAYFSKARHSSTVPVIYAEKRYVRKPRKSKAGAALCSRCKTIFVRPSLPEDAETQ
jgi:hypothetical protein